MTLQQLVTLASTTLSQVPHHPAITPELCAAICWQESTGDPNVLGDRNKKTGLFQARGLAQFHEATWKRFAHKRFACPTHAGVSINEMHRACARCAMGPLINELSYAARRASSVAPL